VTSPLFYHMRTENSNNNTTSTCTPEERALLDFIQECEPAYLAKALNSIYRMALYRPDSPIQEREKTELLHVKLLLEELEKL
jgi:hypothetical protein